MKANLVINYKQKYYKLGVIEFRASSDGSMYIFLDRHGKSRKSTSGRLNVGDMSVENLVQHKVWQCKTTKISYHATGMVHFQKGAVETSRFFAEPLVEVTNINPIFMYSIPKIEKLEAHTKPIKASDVVITPIVPDEGRIRFDFSISPPNTKLANNISMTFANLFSLNIQVLVDDIKLPKDQKNMFITYKPERGCYSAQRISQDQATIAFHQKVNNTKGVVLYPPNNEGTYKIFFTVPKRIPPLLTVEFFETSLIAVECGSKKSRAFAQFKIYRVDGNQHKHLIKIVTPIKSIFMDSEFYDQL